MRWRHAATFRARLGGLLVLPPLQEGEALLLDPCRAVHTFGMRYPIDVVFLDGAGHVLRIVPRLGPGRLAICAGAVRVAELKSGEAVRQGWFPGMRLCIPARKR